MPTKIETIMSNHVHLVLLRSVLGVMLTIDSVLLETEGGASGMAAVWHHTVSFFFPSGGSYGRCKATQEHASDAESATLMS